MQAMGAQPGGLEGPKRGGGASHAREVRDVTTAELTRPDIWLEDDDGHVAHEVRSLNLHAAH